MPGDYTLRDVDGCLVIELHSSNLLNVNEVSRIGRDLTDDLKHRDLKARPQNAVLDLSKVKYAGSAALGMFVSISKQLQESGCRLMLAGAEHLQALFKASRTLAIFEISADVPSAVAAMKK